jgi:hypothetical protein
MNVWSRRCWERLAMGLSLLSLLGCGGGGGDGGGSGSSGSALEELAARDRAFANEAVERVLDRSLVSCTAVACLGDGEASELEDGPLGMSIAACHYDCLPVEIDEAEQRRYQVRLLWRRLPTTCYELEAYEVFILAQVRVPCIPTP